MMLVVEIHAKESLSLTTWSFPIDDCLLQSAYKVGCKNLVISGFLQVAIA
jgi:hypothetical protein